MDRRTFLKATGGLAAGAALSPEFLRAAASQIEHIVVVMMENRSFDHLLGWLPNADGKQSGLSYTDVNGASHADAQPGARLDRVRLQRSGPQLRRRAHRGG